MSDAIPTNPTPVEQFPISTIESTPSRFASRKFLLSLFVAASATFLVWNEKIADGVYSAVVIATAAAYIAGNLSQKATAKTGGAV